MHVGWQEVIIFFLVLSISNLLLYLSKTACSSRAVHARLEAHSIHSDVTPRIGGAAIFGGVLTSLMLADKDVNKLHNLFVLSLIPIIMIGLVEDLFFQTRPSTRLAAIVASNMIAITITNYWLPRIGIPPLNQYMLGPFGIFVTIGVITGITNAYNLMDGLNGLAAGISCLALVAINTISVKIGYEGMIHLSMMYIAGLAAFLIMNFPRARIFLGDSGAYMLGFIISWFGVAILRFSENVRSTTFLLIFIYPITDMIFAIVRRKAYGQLAFSADAKHMHHLVMRFVAGDESSSWRSRYANPLATAVILPFAGAPMILATQSFNDLSLLYIGAGAFVVFYLLSYALLAARIGSRARSSVGGASQVMAGSSHDRKSTHTCL